MDESEKEQNKLDSELIEKRKEKIAHFFKKGNNWIFIIILAVITWLAVFIRTRNLNGLKDITTGTWTLGPDLDPFLFLRWAEYIVQHGQMMTMDMMRYVPLGYNTAGEMKLLSYMIAWFYDFLSIFMKDVTVTYAAIIFPVFMFALTCIAFFFLTRKVFYDHFENKNYPNLIALISVFFLSVVPSLLPRTIAGIPEKESAGFLFIFLSLYFLICSFKSKTYKSSIIYSILAGISTGILGLVWGGATFVFMTAGVAFNIYFILGQIDKKRFVSMIAWVATFMPFLMIFSSRFNPMTFFVSTSTLPIVSAICFAGFNLFIYNKIKEKSAIKKLVEKYHLSGELASLLIVLLILLVLSMLILGVNFIPNQVIEVIDNLIHPFGTDRVALTVAENKQPYFDEWAGNFGPVVLNIPLFFWLFIIGSVVLFYELISKFEKKDKIILTGAYFLFLMGLIFSRYKESGILNGVSTASLLVYFGGTAILLGACIYTYFRYIKENKQENFKLDFGFIVIFLLFFISIVAARGGVRLVMMLVPPTSIMVGYLAVNSFKLINKDQKDDMKKLFSWIFIFLIFISVIYSGYFFYNISKSQAESFVPNIYTYQWQKAMSWVRNNTSENAVFGHWWDYGYWLQSIGNRATVLDGGNAIIYWDHLMGRHVLTTPNDKTALDFLYTHNATHLLIDSSDIGKYTAFSSIGADENYDRYSYIPTFTRDDKLIEETATGFTYVYVGGTGLDEDIIWEQNGSKIYLTKETSGLAGISIEEKDGQLLQPIGVFVQNNQPITIPLKYMYYNNTLKEYDSGLDAGIFMIETINLVNQNQIKISKTGAMFYLSKRTVHSLLARKYLFGEEDNFKLVHNEPSLVVDQLRLSNPQIDDFIIYQGSFQGPIKIWEINYPAGMQINESYLVTDYPNIALRRSG
ncbi:MAG: STT3 domain-containing protein [Candidatus Pacearchaeota archaeon]